MARSRGSIRDICRPRESRYRRGERILDEECSHSLPAFRGALTPRRDLRRKHGTRFRTAAAPCRRAPP